MSIPVDVLDAKAREEKSPSLCFGKQLVGVHHARALLRLARQHHCGGKGISAQKKRALVATERCGVIYESQNVEGDSQEFKQRRGDHLVIGRRNNKLPIQAVAIATHTCRVVIA